MILELEHWVWELRKVERDTSLQGINRKSNLLAPVWVLPIKSSHVQASSLENIADIVSILLGLLLIISFFLDRV